MGTEVTYRNYPITMKLVDKFPTTVEPLRLNDLARGLSRPIEEFVLGKTLEPGEPSLNTYLKYPNVKLLASQKGPYKAEIARIKERLTPDILEKIRNYQNAVQSTLNELTFQAKRTVNTNIRNTQKEFISIITDHDHVSPWLNIDFNEIKINLNKPLVGVLFAVAAFTFISVSNPFKKTDSA